MHIYWSSIILLPVSITKEIENLMRSFVWCRCVLKHGSVEVSWSVVCKPKCQDEGWVFKDYHTWILNCFLIIFGISLFRKVSLWVGWIHAYRLRSHNFWDVPLTSNASFGWRKLLNMRDVVKSFVFVEIDNGICISTCFGQWDTHGPIIKFISKRKTFIADFDMNTKACDLEVNQC